MALAENVVIALKIAAIREITMNDEVAKPTLPSVLEFGGDRVEPAVVSTPHTNWVFSEWAFCCPHVALREPHNIPNFTKIISKMI